MISAAITGIAIKKKPSTKPPTAIRIAPIIKTHRMISNGPTLLTWMRWATAHCLGAPIRLLTTYLSGLTAHVSGANAPAGQVPVVWQYGCRSATLADGQFLDRALPPPCSLMAPGVRVAALSPRDGHIDLFTTDSSGVVWSNWWEATPGWQLWFPVSPGPKMQPGAPVTAIRPRDGHIDLFVADQAGIVWSTWWEAEPGWQPWFQLRPEFRMQAGAPVTAIVPRDGHIDLFAVGSDGRVWSTWWETTAGWQPWFQISDGTIAPGATVTALVPRDGHIDLVAADTGGKVWSTWWEVAPGWQRWFQIHGESAFAGGVTVGATAPRDGHIDLFVTDNAGTVWSTWWETAPNWQPWFQISPGVPMQGGATVTPLVPRDGHIDLFVTDAAGVVWSTWWESAPGWQSWFAPFPGVPLAAGAPVTALARIGHIDLFATAGNGAVFTAWWESAPGWMKWFMPGSVQKSDLESRIKSWRSSNQIPPFAPDQLLMVFTKTLRLSNQGVEFCGFHSKLGAGEYYSITPLLTPDARCSNNDTASFQSVISHELQEAMTDPDVATGWSDALSEEGGDPGACNFNRQALPFGAVQRFADNQGQTCST